MRHEETTDDEAWEAMEGLGNVYAEYEAAKREEGLE